jgi:hypothetical protein
VVYALVNVVAPSEYDLQNLHVCYFKSSVWYLEIRCPQIKRRKNASGLVNVPIKHQPTKWGHLPTPWFFPLKLPFVRSILHSWTNLSEISVQTCGPVRKWGGSPISMTQLKRKMLIDYQIWQVYSSKSYIEVYRLFSAKHTYTTTSTDLQDFFEPRFWMFDTPLKKFSARHWAAVTFQGQPQPKPIAMQQRCPLAILQDHRVIY